MKMHHRYWYRFFQLLLAFYVRVFYLHLTYRQKCAFPKGPKIFAVNHPTVWDAFPILVYFPLRDYVHVMVEDQIWSYQMPKFFFTFSNQIKMYRDKRSVQSMKDALQMLKLPASCVLISPEGGRTPQSRKVRGRRGVVRLALEAKAPIIPMGVYLKPRSIVHKRFYYDYQGKQYSDNAEIPKFRARYGLVFGEPIYLDKYYDRKLSMDEYQELSNMVLDRIYALSDEAQALV